jgi:hypothetical protein
MSLDDVVDDAWEENSQTTNGTSWDVRQSSDWDGAVDPNPNLDQDEFHELLAWVKASDRRKQILSTLEEAPHIMHDFDWDVSMEGVRYHFRQLKEPHRADCFTGQQPALIESVTPNREKYQLYSLTEVGERVVEYL